MTENELHWLAGWLEGEGCFGIRKRRATGLAFSIAANTTDRDIAERAAALVGANVCSRQPRADNLGKKTIYHFSLGRMPEVISLMRQLLPIMGERRAAKIKSILTRYENYHPMTRFECGAERGKKLRAMMEESAREIEAMRAAGMSLNQIGVKLGLSHSAVGNRLYRYSKTYIRQLSAELKNRAKTHCDYGHPLTGENLRVRMVASGGIARQCKICHRRRQLKYYHQKRARKEAA